MARDTNVHKTAGRAAAADPADPAASVVDLSATTTAMDSAVVQPTHPADADPPPGQTPEAAQVDDSALENVTAARRALLGTVAEIDAAGFGKPLPEIEHLFGVQVMPDLEVTATARRRRAGRAFGSQPTVIPSAELTEELLAELDGDPFLKLRPVPPSGP